MSNGEICVKCDDNSIKGKLHFYYNEYENRSFAKNKVIVKTDTYRKNCEVNSVDLRLEKLRDWSCISTDDANVVEKKAAYIC